MKLLKINYVLNNLDKVIYQYDILVDNQYN
jgi:hypothetical protein